MTKDSVLGILRKDPDYISGEAISSRLGVSRAAVHMAVKALRAEGYGIVSATNKGYCLRSIPDALTANELLPYLGAERMETVLCVDAVDSTNNRLRDLALSGAPEGQVVLANQQLRGRGRRGREFYSPRDKGIYLSVLLRPDSLPADTIEITAWAAVAVGNAIETVCGIRPGIKWVNDLVCNGKKVCGILTEMSVESESGYVQYLLLGLGLNVNQKPEDFPEDLRSIATSLSTETGHECSRAQLAAAIIRELDAMWKDWPGSRAQVLDTYRRDDTTVGKEITVVRNLQERNGTAVSIDDDFSLYVRYEDGSCQKLSGGEVTIRGLYGQ